MYVGTCNVGQGGARCQMTTVLTKLDGLDWRSERDWVMFTGVATGRAGLDKQGEVTCAGPLEAGLDIAESRLQGCVDW